MPKKELLCLCDSPTTHTGFGRVALELLSKAHERFDVNITVWGINHDGKEDSRFKIIDAREYGNDKYDFLAVDQLCKYILEHDFDAFWSVQDAFNMQKVAQTLHRKRDISAKEFKSIFYFPVDVPGIPESWCKTAMLFDYPVVYTEFGKEQMRSRLGPIEKVESMKVAYHGTNTKDFFPLPEEDNLRFRYENHHILGNQFLFMNLNKNQVRKDIPTTMLAFRFFMKWWKQQKYETAEPKLLLHMNSITDSGEHLPLLRDQHFTDVAEHIIFPVFPIKGFSVADINKYYNACDCLISSSLGEGWGLSTTEAMACKTPIIVPMNTANFEILGKATTKMGDAERGRFCESGADDDHWRVMDRSTHYGDPMRPVTSVRSLGMQMVRIFKECTDEKGNRLSKPRPESLVNQQIDAAYQWVHELTWDKVFDDVWDGLFALALDRRE